MCAAAAACVTGAVARWMGAMQALLPRLPPVVAEGHQPAIDVRTDAVTYSLQAQFRGATGRTPCPHPHPGRGGADARRPAARADLHQAPPAAAARRHGKDQSTTLKRLICIDAPQARLPSIPCHALQEEHLVPVRPRYAQPV